MTVDGPDEARRLVEAALAESAREDGIERAIIGDPVEAGAYWVFFYQGREYLDSGDLDAMLVGNGPIVVPRDGSPLFALSAAEDTDAQIRRLAEESPGTA